MTNEILVCWLELVGGVKTAVNHLYTEDMLSDLLEANGEWSVGTVTGLPMIESVILCYIPANDSKEYSIKVGRSYRWIWDENRREKKQGYETQ